MVPNTKEIGSICFSYAPYILVFFKLLVVIPGNYFPTVLEILESYVSMQLQFLLISVPITPDKKLQRGGNINPPF